MTTPADSWKWLRGDWGKPNLLTRAGIPRIATNLLTYLLVTDWFLRDRYGPDRRARQRFQFFRNNWKDTFVKIHSLSLAASMVLLLVGALYFRQHLK
jgi:hypothetical protein